MAKDTRQSRLQGINWFNPVHLLALGFGSGAMPKAPGTWGTAVAVPIYLLVEPLPLVYYLALVLVLSVAGIWICHAAAEAMGVHDHPGIVWDEIVGYLVTMVAAPSGWEWCLLGFLLFRFFDIVKPPPIRAIDRHVEGGWGIMLDDLLAGVFAALVLQLVAYGLG